MDLRLCNSTVWMSQPERISCGIHCREEKFWIVKLRESKAYTVDTHFTAWEWFTLSTEKQRIPRKFDQQTRINYECIPFMRKSLQGVDTLKSVIVRTASNTGFKDIPGNLMHKKAPSSRKNYTKVESCTNVSVVHALQFCQIYLIFKNDRGGLSVISHQNPKPYSIFLRMYIFCSVPTGSKNYHLATLFSL